MFQSIDCCCRIDLGTHVLLSKTQELKYPHARIGRFPSAGAFEGVRETWEAKLEQPTASLERTFRQA